MASIPYHVVVPFDRDGDGELRPGEGQEMPSGETARRRALALAGRHAGAVAFSRIGDPATGEFSPAVVIVQAGEVNLRALSS